MTSSIKRTVTTPRVIELCTKSKSISMNSRSRSFLLFLISSIMVASIIIASGAAQAATPPPQPSEGPGGSDYVCSRVTSSVHGSGDLRYYLYEPASPKPETAPLIVFTHGWGGTDPSLSYGAWINHLVRKGNIVVYPVYQSASSMLNGARYTSNCVKAVLDAIQVLAGAGHVTPDLDKFATVGHSVGGVLAANIAAVALKSGLPAPRAVMSVEPGNTPMPPLENMSSIPSDALLLTLVGDQDSVVGFKDAQKIFTQTRQIPLENKDYIILGSDNSGRTALVADHFAPTCWGPLAASMPGIGSSTSNIEGSTSGSGTAGFLADIESTSSNIEGSTSGSGTAGFLADIESTSPDASDAADGDVSASTEALTIPGNSGLDFGTKLGFGTNALDYYGTWKLFDALTDAAFYGKNREYALGNTPEQRYMGNWSNGNPVKELIVTDDPQSQPTTSGRRSSSSGL